MAVSGFFPEADVIERKRAPKRVASYVLGARLGRGAYAKVKEGYHVDRPHSRLAIKIIDLARLRKKMLGVETFRAEISILKTLNHPRIVQYVDSFEDNRKGKIYIALEYMAGGDLQHLIDRRRLSVSEIRGVFRSLMEGLSYLHSVGIVHQDIKPSNLLINGVGAVKISDFGVAQFVHSEEVTIDVTPPPTHGTDDPAKKKRSKKQKDSNLQSSNSISSSSSSNSNSQTNVSTTSSQSGSYSPKSDHDDDDDDDDDGKKKDTTHPHLHHDPIRTETKNEDSESSSEESSESSSYSSSSPRVLPESHFKNQKQACDDCKSSLRSPSQGVQGGAPAFQPPELAGATGSINPATDIWSAGITLYRLVRDCFPFPLQDCNVYHLWNIIAKGEFEIPDDVEEDLRDLLRRMLEVNPKLRITAEEILSHPWLAGHSDDQPLNDISFAPTLFPEDFGEQAPKSGSDQDRSGNDDSVITGESRPSIDQTDGEEITGADTRPSAEISEQDPGEAPPHQTHPRFCRLCIVS